MAISKPLLVFVLLSFFLVLHLSQAQEMVNTVDPETKNTIDPETISDSKINCGGACAARCKLASRQKICLRACGTCCARCNCVPPGTSGNQKVCPCYYNMTTHGGRRKCP